MPLQNEILRMHLMIIALPFFSLLVWALLGEAYQGITIVLLMGLLYLLPKKTQENDVKTGASDRQNTGQNNNDT